MDASSSIRPTTRPAEYVVVARRYRPQSFADLVGQEQVSLALSKAIESHRVGHAYLFTGARGVGKTSAARILAKALNCEQGPTAIPCNTCDICQSVTSGEDVDVLEIDGASSRGIDEIRQLRSNVNVRPSRARFKIYIIDEVHMFTREAFNALLKTLEEPPEHVKFIFCTTDPEKIPITVLSRCQRFDFPPVQTASIAERLRTICQSEGIAADPEALQLLARRAAGSMRDSQSLLEQLLSFCDGRIVASDVHKMLGTARGGSLAQLATELAERRADGALRALEAAIQEGVDVGQLAEQLMAYFRDVLAAAVGCNAELLLQALPDDYPQLQQLGTKLGVETLLAVIQVLDQAITRMRQSPHVRTLLEVALVRIARLGELDEISRLVGQLQSGIPPTAGRGSAASSPSGGPMAGEKKTTDRTIVDASPSVDPTTETELPELDAATTPPQPPSEALAQDPAVGGPVVGSEEGPIELNSATAEAVWRRILQHLEAAADITADFAAKYVTVQAVGSSRLVIEFQNEYNKNYCERPERMNRIQQAATAVVGGPVQLQFTLATRPADGAEARQPAMSRRQRQRELENHPFVAQAKQMFDAEVVDVQEPRRTERPVPTSES